MHIRPHLKTSVILIIAGLVMALIYTRIYLQSEDKSSVFIGACICIVGSTSVMRSIVRHYYHEDTESMRANINRCLLYYSIYLVSFWVMMWIDTLSFGQSIQLTFALLLAGILVIEPARNELLTKGWRIFLRVLWIVFVAVFAYIAIVYHPQWSTVSSVVIGLLIYLFLEVSLTWIFRKRALQSAS